MFLEIAKIGKPHGLYGETNVYAISDIDERFKVGNSFSVGYTPEAISINLTIKSVRQSKTKSDYYIIFEGIETREQVDLYRGMYLFSEPLEDAYLKEKEYWVHELYGAEVFEDGKTSIGKVQEVISNPASDLLKLSDTVFIPVTFITKFDKKDKKIYVDLPIGLLEVNEDDPK